MHGRIVIPIHDEHGLLLAYAGRSIDETEPKYKLPSGFHKSLVLYNLQRLLPGDGAGARVVIVEGFFDCMKLHRAGLPAVALMGSSMSETQEQLLIQHFTAVWLLLDGDEAGQQATDELLVRLGRHLWVQAPRIEKGIQPDMLAEEELKRLLGDK